EESENLSIQRYTSRIDALTVEQSGPVRAVVKVEGSHVGNGRQWLPFSLRLYFTADSPAVRIVHSFIWDGDADRDFLRGLGIRAQVPMAAPLHDRHVRIATDHGLFSEAVRPLTGLRRDVGEAFRQAQIDGRATPSVDTLPDRLRQLLDS